MEGQKNDASRKGKGFPTDSIESEKPDLSKMESNGVSSSSEVFMESVQRGTLPKIVHVTSLSKEPESFERFSNGQLSRRTDGASSLVRVEIASVQSRNLPRHFHANGGVLPLNIPDRTRRISSSSLTDEQRQRRKEEIEAYMISKWLGSNLAKADGRGAQNVQSLQEEEVEMIIIEEQEEYEVITIEEQEEDQIIIIDDQDEDEIITID
ncbi:hypothetical protein HNY73_010971 [Argiope bruennichi]|uniref:Uncharacterized protein n=1 Tax=Argiope bruennichi TaxID=94029 RepID=A0A8T0F2P7_ARGBR|nr:hypothetical protein HNY73_010971 [Argiope bruennichi]